MALTAQGRLYALGQNQLSAQQAEKAEFSPGKNGAVIFDDVSISGDGQTLIWTESRAWGQVYVSDLKPGSTPAKISLPAEAAAPAVSLGGGIIVPLSNGTVVWLAREGGAKAAPFMPPLVPDALPLWTKPTVLADDRTFLISDGRSIVYAVTKKDAPQLQLALVGQSSTSGPIASPLVQTGSTGFGVIRQERSDAVGGFDARGAAAFEPIPLQGRVEAGPFAVGGLALVAAEPDGLVCIASDGKIRWQLPPDRGPIAGPPAALPEGDLLIAFQSGIVCRLDASSGKELAQHDVGEPLAGPVCLVGQQVLLAGSDGVVHRISIPPRP
jgi:outer membrane protein assembly factor BamB